MIKTTGGTTNSTVHSQSHVSHAFTHNTAHEQARMSGHQGGVHRGYVVNEQRPDEVALPFVRLKQLGTF